MTNTKARLRIVLIAIVIAFLLPCTAYADALEARITSEGITTNERELLGVSDLLPGDSYSTTLTVTNDTSRTQQVNFYLDYSNLPEVKEFAKTCEITITSGENEIMQGHLVDVASDPDGLHIFTLAPDESEVIDIELALPFEADESHMDQFATFEWSLHAEGQGLEAGSLVEQFSPPLGSFFAKTGATTYAAVIAAALCAFCAIASILPARKRTRTDKDKTK